jgi:hypothetical protein
VAKTKEHLGALGKENSIVVLPLYASLPHHLQMKAIGAAPRHVERKVIVSTNIAETSLTIDGANHRQANVWLVGLKGAFGVGWCFSHWIVLLID